MKDKKWEQMLKQALTPEVEPDENLNQRIIHQLKERSQMKQRYTRRLSAGLVATVLLFALSISAFAAVHLFSAREVAEQFGDQVLAEAFESKDAIRLNQVKASGNYRFTLHGLVTGAGLSEFKHSAEEIFPDRTYAVVSISRLDGKPMPSTSESEYGEDPFFISPLIKGQEPWRVNIVTMNGGYSETVIDGITYRIIECDEVEMFADRGVYLAISSGTVFYSNEAFRYDEVTGEIYARDDYPGAALLFDLPLDPTKADQAKAEAYLEKLLNPASTQASRREGSSQDTIRTDWVEWIDSIREKVRNGEAIGKTIPETIKEVTYDSAGNMSYAYEDWQVTVSLEDYFEEGQTGFADKFSISGDGESYKVLLFHRDENDVITGRIVILD